MKSLRTFLFCFIFVLFLSASSSLSSAAARATENNFFVDITSFQVVVNIFFHSHKPVFIAIYNSNFCRQTSAEECESSFSFSSSSSSFSTEKQQNLVDCCNFHEEWKSFARSVSGFVIVGRLDVAQADGTARKLFGVEEATLADRTVVKFWPMPTLVKAEKQSDAEVNENNNNNNNNNRTNSKNKTPFFFRKAKAERDPAVDGQQYTGPILSTLLQSKALELVRDGFVENVSSVEDLRGAAAEVSTGKIAVLFVNSSSSSAAAGEDQDDNQQQDEDADENSESVEAEIDHAVNVFSVLSYAPSYRDKLAFAVVETTASIEGRIVASELLQRQQQQQQQAQRHSRVSLCLVSADASVPIDCFPATTKRNDKKTTTPIAVDPQLTDYQKLSLFLFLHAMRLPPFRSAKQIQDTCVSLRECFTRHAAEPFIVRRAREFRRATSTARPVTFDAVRDHFLSLSEPARFSRSGQPRARRIPGSEIVFFPSVASVTQLWLDDDGEEQNQQDENTNSSSSSTNKIFSLPQFDINIFDAANSTRDLIDFIPRALFDSINPNGIKDDHLVSPLLSPRGAFTALHWDPPQFGGGFMHLVKGRKIWNFIHPKHLIKIVKAGMDQALPPSNLKTTSSSSSSSSLDSDSLMQNNEEIEISWTEARAGDSVYFPPGYLHRVWTEEKSMGIAAYLTPSGAAEKVRQFAMGEAQKCIADNECVP